MVGKSRTTPPEQEHDLSLANLQRDLIGVIQHLFPDSQAAPALLVRAVYDGHAIIRILIHITDTAATGAFHGRGTDLEGSTNTARQRVQSPRGDCSGCRGR